MWESWSPRQESNLHLALRRHSFYPLNYGERTAQGPTASAERAQSIANGIRGIAIGAKKFRCCGAYRKKSPRPRVCTYQVPA